MSVAPAAVASGRWAHLTWPIACPTWLWTPNTTEAWPWKRGRRLQQWWPWSHIQKCWPPTRFARHRKTLLHALIGLTVTRASKPWRSSLLKSAEKWKERRSQTISRPEINLHPPLKARQPPQGINQVETLAMQPERERIYLVKAQKHQCTHKWAPQSGEWLRLEHRLVLQHPRNIHPRQLVNKSGVLASQVLLLHVEAKFLLRSRWWEREGIKWPLTEIQRTTRKLL